MYSSATGLSTTSPTSLADEEDSIIDDDIEDEELCEEACSIQFNSEFDYRKCREYRFSPSDDCIYLKKHS